MRYQVEKCETVTSINGNEYESTIANYGIMCEEDLAMTVRGYKANKMDEETIIYTRRNSKYYFVATVV